MKTVPFQGQVQWLISLNFLHVFAKRLFTSEALTDHLIWNCSALPMRE